MSDRKRTKKQVERDTRAEEATRLAYIGTLASGLAHEIRSPLSAMKMNLDLLREDLDSVSADKRADFSKRLELITREADGLQNLLTEFLSFARPPSMEMLPTDLNQLLLEMAQFLAPACKQHHVQVVTDFQKDLYPVPLDQNQFGRGVILNLLTNALEQIKEQGTITLRTREAPDYLEVEIEDNGGGVKPENEAHIFELFFSTKAHGTGLGLAIARRIVREHGGELTLQNRVNQGATFTIRLPKSKILELSAKTP